MKMKNEKLIGRLFYFLTLCMIYLKNACAYLLELMKVKCRLAAVIYACDHVYVVFACAWWKKHGSDNFLFIISHIILIQKSYSPLFLSYLGCNTHTGMQHWLITIVYVICFSISCVKSLRNVSEKDSTLTFVDLLSLFKVKAIDNWFLLL